MQDKKKLFMKLFTSTFALSAFTFGGGYVIIPLMKERFVDELHWLEEEEMLNLTAIAQSSPGAVAVNAAILVGYRLAGPVGALISICGTVLPPLLILSVISFFYAAFRSNVVIGAVLKGMQAGVAAVIANVVFNMGSKVIRAKEALSIAVMIGAFAATFFLHVNVMYIILACGVIGAAQVLLGQVRKGGEPQ